MNALISFRKQSGKPIVFTFRRTDGTSTWAKLGSLPIEHDLAHYVVEKTLGFKQGFFGLLNQGFKPEDFELPREKRPTALLPTKLPLEALQTEHLVGRLQTEQVCGENPDFMADLEEALKNQGITFPDQLNLATLAKIRNEFTALIEHWHSLQSGGQLDLELNL